MSENLLNNQNNQNQELTVPEKFMNKETGEVNVQALLKSYLSLEKMMSEKSASMPKLPNSAKEYKITPKQSYLEIDPQLNEQLFEAGFTEEQAQMVYDLAEDKLIPLVVDIATSFQADKERGRLEAKFGGSDKWSEVSRQLNEYGKKKLNPNVFEGLCSCYDGVLSLYNMMQEDAPVISLNNDVQYGSSEEELHKMMKDKRYWQKKDPAFIEKVTNGFQKLYK